MCCAKLFDSSVGLASSSGSARFLRELVEQPRGKSPRELTADTEIIKLAGCLGANQCVPSSPALEGCSCRVTCVHTRKLQLGDKVPATTNNMSGYSSVGVELCVNFTPERTTQCCCSEWGTVWDRHSPRPRLVAEGGRVLVDTDIRT